MHQTRARRVCTGAAAPCDWVINKQEEEGKRNHVLNDVRPADVISCGGFDASHSACVIQGVRDCTEIQKWRLYLL